MGLIVKYLDALSDDGRDRVIVAEEFDNGQYINSRGVGCLVGVAEREYFSVGYGPFPPVQKAVGRTRWSNDRVCERFDAICRRFGKARVVAACKARAAKGNRLHEIRAEIYKGITVRDVMAWRERAAGELVPQGGMNGRVQ